MGECMWIGDLQSHDTLMVQVSAAWWTGGRTEGPVTMLVYVPRVGRFQDWFNSSVSEYDAYWFVG